MPTDSINAAALVSKARSLADTIGCEEFIAKREEGDITARFGEGVEIVIHKKEDTLKVLESQKSDLIDDINSLIDSLDRRPKAE